MEASQASEAGSIPVARSSPARPRAGRFCYAHFAPTVYRMRRDNRRNTLPARATARGSGTKLAQLELHGATSGTKLTQHAPHGASSGTKLAQHAPHPTSPGTKLTQHAQNPPIWRVLLMLGEFYPVFVANKPSMANFLPHKHQHHHRHERNNTPTQHTKPRDEILSAHAPETAPHNETFTAPARHKQPKFAHFHHAGANFLSQHTPHTHTRATFLSTNASASKIDPNKTFIIFDSVTGFKPALTQGCKGVTGFIATKQCTRYDTNAPDSTALHWQLSSAMPTQVVQCPWATSSTTEKRTPSIPHAIPPQHTPTER